MMQTRMKVKKEEKRNVHLRANVSHQGKGKDLSAGAVVAVKVQAAHVREKGCCCSPLAELSQVPVEKEEESSCLRRH